MKSKTRDLSAEFHFSRMLVFEGENTGFQDSHTLGRTTRLFRLCLRDRRYPSVWESERLSNEYMITAWPARGQCCFTVAAVRSLCIVHKMTREKASARQHVFRYLSLLLPFCQSVHTLFLSIIFSALSKSSAVLLDKSREAVTPPDVGLCGVVFSHLSFSLTLTNFMLAMCKHEGSPGVL